jgi:Lon-like protease
VRRYVTPGRLLALGLLLLAVVFVLWALPSSEYIFLPDRAHPVGPLVTVAGAHEDRDGGGIYFVDVIVRKASLLERLFGGLHQGADLVPASAVVGPGLSGAQEHDLDVAEMDQSQQVAAAVAFRTAGRKVTLIPNGAVVEDLQPHSPAAAKLAPGDVIVAVDGTPVRGPAGIASVMKHKRIGETVTFTVRRGSAEKLFKLKTVASTGAKPHHAVVGVYLGPSERIHLPQAVSIDSNGVVGPSAGLAFALDVLEKLGRDVDRGRKIAATGEIQLNGHIAPIGGIKQKTYGAREAGVDVFLVPVQNAATARKYAHGLKIIPVKSFQQALHALATLPNAPAKG